MCNVGMLDKVLRALVGMAIIAWGLATQNIWGFIGLIPFGTAALSFCPLYTILRINTGCKIK